ncbi:uncharacterized protein [Panulirus ornatus]
MTSFFLVAQMAGAGFLALPRALADAGWLGIPMLLIFCISVAFAGTRLGRCWVILEERWPEYREPARQPYMEIAYKSLGNTGRKVTLWSVVLNLFGSTTVFIILISEMISGVISSLEVGDCTITKCQLVIIVGVCMIPITWLGTPKDFWQASVLAVVSTLVAVVVIIVTIFVERDTLPENPVYPNPTVTSFSLGFGAILFAFGGAAVFPTIQNDMKDRSEFWKSVIVGFLGILAMYLPVGITGYVMYGNEVDNNILQAVDPSIPVIVAIALEIVNLMCTYIISLNPVAQSVEEILSIPDNFGWKRCLLRTAMVVLQMIICLAVPDFGLILNLIGGSLITLCTFILPPLMYMKLIDQKSEPGWPVRSMPRWERIYLVEIMIVGIIGGISSTISAFQAIITASLDQSCFIEFGCS